MPISGSTEGELVGAIYDTAIDQRTWEPLLRNIAVLLEASAAMLVVYDRDTTAIDLLFTTGALSDSRREVVRRIGDCPQVSRLLEAAPGALVHDVAGGASAWADRIAEPCGLGAAIGALLLRKDACGAVLLFYRPRAAGAFSAKSWALFGRLVPHLQRAIRLNRTWQAQRHLQTLLERAFDQVRHGMAVVTRSGRVLVVNEAARRIFAAADGLAVRDDRLVTDWASDAHRLEVLVKGGADAAGRNDARPAGMLLPRRSGQQPYRLAVAPLPTGALGESAAPSEPAVLLSIEDAEADRGLAASQFRAMFRLTDAEARLAAALVAGKRPIQIAEEFQVAVPTIRTHLRRLFRKTGASNQVELVRSLSDSARLHAPPSS